ncbi:MAG: phosphodiester glycosidase family protein [Deltaproteobacteria bacterium]|nr:phosphodiester glycosidase family protein [Deltaproteobacteria bacterium]
MAGPLSGSTRPAATVVRVAGLAVLSLAIVTAPAFGALRFQKYQKTIEGEPVAVFVARDDGHEPRTDWVSLGAGSYPTAGLSVPEMAARAAAAVAVNANFYREDAPGQQEPIGLVVHEGKILAVPARSYPSAGVIEGTLQWDKVELRARAGRKDAGGDARLSKLCRVNSPPPSEDCVSLWTRPLENLGHAIYFAGAPAGLSQGRFEFKASAHGNWALQWTKSKYKAAKNAVLVLDIRLNGARLGEKWQKVTEAVSGSHVLTPENTMPSITHSWALSRQPRTMLGADKEGGTWVAVFDGRRENSKGVSLKDGWEFLHRNIAATWALNLDGGGSSTMIYEGRLVNKPSDTYLRAVAVGFGAKVK